jgi:nitrous oxide reductase accessory protein NosL
MPIVVLPDGRKKKFGEADAGGKYKKKDEEDAKKFAKENGGVVVYDYASGGPVRNVRGMGQATRGGRFRD